MAVVASTRRAQRRAATLAEIKGAALAQIAERGAPALSLRALAATIGMSPAGLYRYYPGRHALLTDLLADAYLDLATSVDRAIASAGTSPRRRLIAGVLAYRNWCADNRNRFHLIFGTPIPGYAAPEDGPTVQAVRRMGDAFYGVAAYAWNRGMLRVRPLPRPPTLEEEQIAADIAQAAPGFPVDAVPVMLGAWSHWHGLAALEVAGHLDWAYPDPLTLWALEAEVIADRFGLEQ